jgi:hypothetical protein
MEKRLIIHREITIILFLISVVIFNIFLLHAKNNTPINSLYFWIPVFFVITLIIYQTVNYSSDIRFVALILIEIFVLTFFLHICEVAPLNGYLPGLDDGYFYYGNTVMIEKYGYPLPPFLEYNLGNAKWPILHFLFITTHQLLGIDLFNLAVWYPSIYSSIGVLFIYIITYVLFKKIPVALFSSLACAALSSYIGMHVRYINEGLAFFFFLIALSLFLLSKVNQVDSKTCLKYQILCIFFAIMAIFSHHFTGLMLVIFFCVMYLSEIVCKYFFRDDFQSIQPSIFFLVILFGLFFFIQLFIENGFLGMVLSIKDALFQSQESVSYVFTVESPHEDIIKSFILKYGNWFFSALFIIIIILFLIFYRADKKYNIIFYFFSWCFLGFCWFVALIKTGTTNALGGGARIFIFIYPFVLMAVSYILYNRSKVLNYLLVFLLVGFIFINIATIQVISFEKPEIIHFTDLRDVTTLNSNDGTQEYLSVLWIKYIQNKEEVSIRDDFRTQLLKFYFVIHGIILDKQRFVNQGVILYRYKMGNYNRLLITSEVKMYNNGEIVIFSTD